jgi:hypothetical protein
MIIRRILAMIVAIAALSVAVPAQAQSWTLLTGAGWLEHEGGLGPAYHLNLRREIAGWTDVWLGSSGEGWTVPAVRLEVELLGQAGRSGMRIAACQRSEGSCVVGADPLRLLGAGFVTRADLTRSAGRLAVYYIPVSGTAFVRSGEIFESPVGTPQTTRERQTALTAGAGNGGGIEIRIGETTAIVEVRAILMRDLEGRRGGALPLSIGLRW